MDIGKIIGSIAPWLGTAIGGPFGAAAGKIVADILGAGDSKEDTIKSALSAATPEQLLLLKNADADYALRMQELGYKNTEDLAKIAADDRTSARAREVAVRDKTPRNLAYGYGAMFFSTLLAFIWIAVEKVVIPPEIKTSIDILLGIEAGMVLGSKEYFFGSSAGSKTKDDTISHLSNGG
jgi:hypothetical protein